MIPPIRPRVEREGDAPAAASVCAGPAIGAMAAAAPEVATPARIQPRIEAERNRADRLELAPGGADESLPGTAAREPRWGLPILALSGFAVLALGLAALQTGNFVADEFRRSPVLGGMTLVVAVTGFGLILWGIVRELRALAALHAVDRLRADLASADPHRRVAAARRWLARVEGGAALRPALDALNDPDAVIPLLRAGMETGLRARADALGRRAAFGVVAGMAATPAPSLVVLLVSWRAIRLIRQVATLYGLRPSLIGTLSLLRRTVSAATATAVTEVAINAATHAVLSTPLLSHLAGEMAGGAVAARRMVVLGRAAAVACTPLPPD
ncbi:MAG: DUF697 domain-containing protein [Gluconacetobacter diazotrophicus]|nr:DUF697 domain-containing protein [Gluconacetobacter diazotrophicus]